MVGEVKKLIKDKVLPPCRVSATEHELIKTKAADVGLSLSEFQRRSLINNCVIIKNSVLDAETVRQLSLIGNNLNQLVKKSHIHNDYDRKHLHDVLSSIDIIIMNIVD